MKDHFSEVLISGAFALLLLATFHQVFPWIALSKGMFFVNFLFLFLAIKASKFARRAFKNRNSEKTTPHVE